MPLTLSVCVCGWSLRPLVPASTGARVPWRVIQEPGCTFKVNGKVSFCKVLLYLILLPCWQIIGNWSKWQEMKTIWFLFQPTLTNKTPWPAADPGFLRRGFCQNCIEMKEIVLSGACPKFHYVDLIDNLFVPQVIGRNVVASLPRDWITVMKKYQC